MNEYIPGSKDQIEDYLNTKINTDTKIQIANFSILWNCFERLCDDKRVFYKTIKLPNGKEQEVFDFDKIVNYMRLTEEELVYIDKIVNEFSVYLKSKGTEYTHNGLCQYFEISLRQIENYTLLDNDSIYIRENDLIVILNIIKKVRNNMYHGRKGIRTLDSQIELFEICNKILMFVLFKLKCEDIIKL